MSIWFKKRYCDVVLLVTIFLSGCDPKKIDKKDYLDGWEYMSTYKVLPLHSITFIKKWPEQILGFAELASGRNNVFILSVRKKAILKPNNYVTDLTTFRELWIELNPNDSVVTPSNLHQSKIYKQIIKFSPFSGAEVLKPEEKIEIKKMTSNRWRIISDLDDFQFEGEFSFSDSSTFTTKHKQMLYSD